LNGICQAVTVPRTKAASSGYRPDGSAVIGKYIGGRDFSDGFDENAAFFDLVYDDPDVLEAGIHFEDIIPALWLGAGCFGDPKQLKPDASWLLQADSPVTVLLDEDRFQPFLKELSTRIDITHVWLVTDSEAAFARMRERIPGERFVGMLYRDYLRNFRINAGVAR
jgi:adenine-specific DNA-methyltransferase